MRTLVVGAACAAMVGCWLPAVDVDADAGAVGINGAGGSAGAGGSDAGVSTDYGPGDLLTLSSGSLEVYAELVTALAPHIPESLREA